MQYWANTVIYRMKRKEFGFLTQSSNAAKGE